MYRSYMYTPLYSTYLGVINKGSSFAVWWHISSCNVIKSLDNGLQWTHQTFIKSRLNSNLC